MDVVVRVALLAALWWMLSSGHLASWIVGAPTVVVAALVSRRLSPPWRTRLSPIATLQFAVFFLTRSVVGGIDVAARAVHPRLPLRPGFVTFELRLPPGNARIWMTNVISLLPGTLSAQQSGSTLTVHTIDLSAPVAENLRAIEDHIAAMFRLELAA